MLNSHSSRMQSLLINSMTHRRIARPLLLNPLPWLLYIEPYSTLAAPPALTRPTGSSCGILTLSGRTLSRICGSCPTLAAYRLERCRGGRWAFGTGGWWLASGLPRKGGIYCRNGHLRPLADRWKATNRPKPKQRARRRVAVFCLWAAIAGRILFRVDDCGAKLGRLSGWCLYSCCRGRPCPPAGTGYPVRGGIERGCSWRGNLGWSLLGGAISFKVLVSIVRPLLVQLREKILNVHVLLCVC